MKLHPILRWLLWPLSLLYGAAVVGRAWLYRIGILRQNRLDAVVISVGNLTVGGTGKTPLVIWLAKQLRTRNKVGVLTRGYRATNRPQPGKVMAMKVETIQVGQSSVKETRLEAMTDQATSQAPAAVASRGSDEVQVMQAHFAGAIPIGVGADRYQSGLELLRRGCTCFVLDDGMQHLRLARDAEIVVVDAFDPFGGHLLPSGRLREPLSALARADMVVITRATETPALVSLIRWHTPAPVFFAQTVLDEVRARLGPSEWPAGTSESDVQRNPAAGEQAVDWRQKKLLAFCGIGNPAAFFHDLERWGFSVAGKLAFPDHHRYSPADLERIESRAAACGAEAAICTEKDIANLPVFTLPRLPLGFARVSLRIDKPEEFLRAVESAVRLRRSGFLV